MLKNIQREIKQQREGWEGNLKMVIHIHVHSLAAQDKVTGVTG